MFQSPAWLEKTSQLISKLIFNSIFFCTIPSRKCNQDEAVCFSLQTCHWPKLGITWTVPWQQFMQHQWVLSSLKHSLLQSTPSGTPHTPQLPVCAWEIVHIINSGGRGNTRGVTVHRGQWFIYAALLWNSLNFRYQRVKTTTRAMLAASCTAAEEGQGQQGVRCSLQGPSETLLLPKAIL